MTPPHLHVGGEDGDGAKKYDIPPHANPKSMKKV